MPDCLEFLEGLFQSWEFLEEAVPSDEKVSEEPWTIGRLLTWTTDYLRRRGSESPRLDAEVLLAPRARLGTRAALHALRGRGRGTHRAGFRELLRRRAEGAPVAYLVGRKEFYSLVLEVSPAVLIPRPETEFAVVEFLELARSLDRPRAVDVGTGSGCLAVACDASELLGSVRGH